MIPEAKIAEAQGDDLRRSHAGEAETEHQLVAEADLPVAPAGREQLPEGLLMGQPAGWVLALDLAVEAGDPPERVVPVGERLDERAGRPSPAGRTSGGTCVTRERRFRTVLLATGRSEAGAPAEHLGVGQLRWDGSARSSGRGRRARRRTGAGSSGWGTAPRTR